MIIEKTAMPIKIGAIFSLIFGLAMPAFSLEPEQILIVANSDIKESLEIAHYYSSKRKVPPENILSLPLGKSLVDAISRGDYEKQLAEPIRERLSGLEFVGKIRCLLTTYGVPIKVRGRGPLKGQEDKLKKLKKLVQRGKNQIKQLEQNNPAGNRQASAEQKKKSDRILTQLQSEIDRIVGKETGACVDSELSMVLFGDYELYRWQPNALKNNVLYWDFRTLMVCRLDGPGKRMAQGLVDKAIVTEKTGLKGVAYIDSRDIADSNKPYSFGWFDQSLRDLAVLTRLRTKMTVEQERTEKLFAPGACPRTAIYCGWYSLKKYIDAFDFVDGAIGYHISSWEAIDLRDPNSGQWCPAMLADGITATLGAVAEPYLLSFPEPRAFFLELFNGRCLVEAYYHTKAFNSWQLVLIGDPLYRPFKKSQASPDDNL
jgi:uncharacterized protein (TIGR03790 family)